MIEAYNLGSQVPNEFLRKAAEVNADVLLWSPRPSPRRTCTSRT